MKHLVVLSEGEIEGLVRGSQKYIFKFFPKRPDFLAKISLDDTIFFKKRKGDALGQFFVGKLLIIENLEEDDWGVVEGFLRESKIGLNEVTFKTFSRSNNVLLVLRVDKLEQFIASPIEVQKNRKEWVVLD